FLERKKKNPVGSADRVLLFPFPRVYFFFFFVMLNVALSPVAPPWFSTTRIRAWLAAGPVTFQVTEPSFAVSAMIVWYEAPPFRESWMSAVPWFSVFEVQVIVWRLPIGHFAPAAGAVTVSVAPTMLNVRSLVSEMALFTTEVMRMRAL